MFKDKLMIIICSFEGAFLVIYFSGYFFNLIENPMDFEARYYGLLNNTEAYKEVINFSFPFAILGMYY